MCLPSSVLIPDAVCPRPERDHYALATLGTRPEYGERFVVDMHATRPAARLDRLANGVLLGRKVDAGEQQRRDVGDLAVVLAHRLGEQTVEHVETPGDAEVLR